MDLTSQPIDLFITQLTYLPFKDVKNLCSSNKKSFDYCTNPKYNNNWKKLIDDTFGNIDHYQNKLEELWRELGVAYNTYNYKVYTRLIEYLDIVTQHMIWYKQGDMESFNKINDPNPRYLALYLLGKKDQIENNFDYLSMMMNDKESQETKDEIMRYFAKYNNFKGVKTMVERGADPGHGDNITLLNAANNKNLRMVDYLVINGASISEAVFNPLSITMPRAVKFLEILVH